MCATSSAQGPAQNHWRRGGWHCFLRRRSSGPSAEALQTGPGVAPVRRQRQRASARGLHTGETQAGASHRPETTNSRYASGFLPSPIPGVSPIQYPRPCPSLSLAMKFTAITFPGSGRAIPSASQVSNAS